MINTLKSLCMLPGISSDEGAVRDFIIERANMAGAIVEIDPMGNVLAFKKGKKNIGSPIMLCAHMDEVGFMVTHIDDSGYLGFDSVGGIDPRVVMGKRVFVGKNHVPGVIGLKPPHLSVKKERESVPELGNMLIDIGAESSEQAEKIVNIADSVVFDSTIRELGGDMIKAKAIDDRIGCAVMLTLMERDLPIDCHFVFTVQEEVGCRGAAVAAFRLNPSIALILEGTTAADLPGVEAGRRVCCPGDGVVVPFMDRGTIYNRELFTKITALADSYGIRWQTKQLIAGGTDAQTIQRSQSGVKTIALAIAVRNIHSAVSLANTRDMESMLRLTELFLEDI